MLLWSKGLNAYIDVSSHSKGIDFVSKALASLQIRTSLSGQSDEYDLLCTGSTHNFACLSPSVIFSTPEPKTHG